MPNWCVNRLVITGPVSDQFIRDCAGIPANYRPVDAEDADYDWSPVKFTFNSLVPVPPFGSI